MLPLRIIKRTGSHEGLWVAVHCLHRTLESLVEAGWASVERLKIPSVWRGGCSDLWSRYPAVNAGSVFAVSHVAYSLVGMAIIP